MKATMKTETPKGTNKALVRSYRVNLCLNPLVHGWLSGIASRKKCLHAGAPSVGLLVSDALEKAHSLGTSFVQLMQVDSMVYATKSPVSSPLKGKKNAKKAKKRP